MRKLIPPREEMDDFLTLLKRYSRQCQTCFEFNLGRGQGFTFGPGWRWTTPLYPLSELQGAICERLGTLDFLSPFGWADGVSRALETFRPGASFYHPSRFEDTSPIETGRDKGKAALVFNPDKARAYLEDLARRIEEIETLMSAEQSIGGPVIPTHRESECQIVSTLRDVGHRCTTTELIREMDKRKLHPSDSTVKKRLAEMVKEGRLDKDPKAKPPGYGLPEWKRGSLGSVGS